MSSHTEKADDTTDTTQAPSPVGQPLFQSLIEHSVDAIALVDSQGKVLYVSPSVQRQEPDLRRLRKLIERHHSYRRFRCPP
jgi:hypothetical protein